METLEQVYAQIHDNVRQYALHKSPEHADEVAQRTIMVLMKKYPHLEEPKDLIPLSIQITKFTLLSVLREAKRGGHQIPEGFDQPDDQATNAEIDLIRRERLERLHRAVKALRSPCAEMLRMVLEGATTDVIRQAFHLTVNAYHVRTHRCRQQLTAALEGAS